MEVSPDEPGQESSDTQITGKGHGVLLWIGVLRRSGKHPPDGVIMNQRFLEINGRGGPLISRALKEHAIDDAVQLGEPQQVAQFGITLQD